MFNVRPMSAPLSRKNLPENPTPDDILNAFLDYLTATDTEPYDHQEETILELFAGNNVILRGLLKVSFDFLLCKFHNPRHCRS